MDTFNLEFAILIARVFLGLVFFIQGYDKVFVLGLSKVIETFKYEFNKPSIPSGLYSLAAYFSSYAELVGGAMLILGLFKSWALYMLGVDLLIVAIGMGMIKPVWNMDNVFSRLSILIFLLLMPSAGDLFSLDRVISYLKLYF